MTASESHSATTTEPNHPADTKARRRLYSWPLSLIGITVGLLLIANGLAACGHPGGHGEKTLADVKEHAEEAVDHMLYKLDATDAQGEEIQAIVAAGLDRLAIAHGPMEDRESAREAFSALLTAETIDAEAVEAMRAQHFARADEMTRIASATLAEALAVLTPEQRGKLDERLQKRHRRFRRWH